MRCFVLLNTSTLTYFNFLKCGHAGGHKHAGITDYNINGQTCMQRGRQADRDNDRHVFRPADRQTNIETTGKYPVFPHLREYVSVCESDRE